MYKVVRNSKNNEAEKSDTHSLPSGVHENQSTPTQHVWRYNDFSINLSTFGKTGVNPTPNGMGRSQIVHYYGGISLLSLLP